MPSTVTITEKCSCGATVNVSAGTYRNDSNPNNPRSAEEIVERWRKDHTCPWKKENG